MKHIKNKIEPSTVDKPLFRALSEVEKRNVDWIWDQRIPTKCITLLEGDGGIGKSMAVSAIVGAITSGRSLPGSPALSPSNVVLLALEDDPEVVLKPRYEQHGADCSKVHFYDQSFILNSENLNYLGQVIREKNAKVVVIDPLVAYFSSDRDSNSSVDVRMFMNGLHELAKQNDLAVICVRHWNKNNSASASQRGSGSVDFRNAARSVLQVIKKGDERYLVLEKSNYAAQAKTIRFEIKSGNLVWGDEIDKSADELLAEIGDQYGTDSNHIDEALMFIDAELEKGPIPSKKLIDAAREFGLSDKVLKRVRKERGVVSWQISDNGSSKWLVGLPHHRNSVKLKTPEDPEVPLSGPITSDPLGPLGGQSEFVL